MKPLTPWGLSVKLKLIERGMTAEDLARVVGATKGSIVRDMMYGIRPGTKYVNKIEQYLGIKA